MSNWSRMSTYLVTGGAGFIGSHVVDVLVAEGHQVRVFDDFSTGLRTNVRSDVDSIVGDIRDKASLKKAMSDVDGVFHLAAMPSVTESLLRPDLTNSVNVDGTLNVFLCAKELGIKRVVFSSSSSIYGEASEVPTTEQAKIQPLNPYALQKYIGELYAKQFCDLFDMNIVALRYFNAYGTRMAEQGAYVNVMSIYIQQLRQGKPLTIYGDGTQSRDFVHVTDIARANSLAMTEAPSGFQVYNIGTGKPIDVNTIARAYGTEMQNIENPRGKGEPQLTCANYAKAEHELGWKPQRSFDEGLDELLHSWGVR